MPNKKRPPVAAGGVNVQYSRSSLETESRNPTSSLNNTTNKGKKTTQKKSQGKVNNDSLIGSTSNPDKWFPTKTFNVTPAGYEYIQGLLNWYGVNKADAALFIHILKGTLLNVDTNGYTPCCSVFRRKFYPGADWRALRDKGLIEELPFSYLAGRSYMFRVVSEIQDAFFQASHSDVESFSHLINLVSGRKKQIQKSSFFDSNNHPIPEKVAEHIKCYANPFKYNKTRALRRLDELKVEMEIARNALEQSEGHQIVQEYKNCYYGIRGALLESLKACLGKKSPLHFAAYVSVLEKATNTAKAYRGATRQLENLYGCKKLLTEYASAKGRYVNDYNALVEVFSNSWKVEGDYWECYPAYKYDEFAGRICYIGGGQQTCSRETQDCLFGDNIYKNNDLVASQVNGVIQLLEYFNIDASWFINYRDLPNNKQHYADLVGISKDAWKLCILSEIMGTDVPVNGNNLQKLFDNLHLVPLDKRSALRKHLYAEAKGDPIVAATYMKRFLEVTAGAIAALKQLHTKLVYEYLPANKKLGTSGNYYITNVNGAKLYITEKRTINGVTKIRQKSFNTLKAEVAAFLLQGNEAHHISHLAKLADDHGYKVIANMHDGLITEGEIPLEAQKEASQLSGLRNARLEEKPWVNRYKQVESDEREEARRQFPIVDRQVWDDEYLLQIHRGDENSPTVDELLEQSIESTGIDLYETCRKLGFDPASIGLPPEVNNIPEVNNLPEVNNIPKWSINDEGDLDFNNDEEQSEWLNWLRTVDDEDTYKKQFARFKQFAVNRAMAAA